MRLKLLLAFALILLFGAGPVVAEDETVEEGPDTYVITHTYTLGDNDSYNEARAQCLREIKREALERSGTFMRVDTQIERYQLTMDQIQELSAAFVQATVLDEHFETEGRMLRLTLKARTRVDPESMRQCIDLLHRETNASQSVTQACPSPAPAVPPAPTGGAGVESATLLPPGQPLPQAMPPALDPAAEQGRVLDAIRNESQAVERYVVKDMTLAEVDSLTGSARGAFSGDDGWECSRHGRYWVVFHYGAVACVRRNLTPDANHELPCHCSGLSTSFLLR